MDNYNDFIELDVGGDGMFQVGRDGVDKILTPADRKIELIIFSDKTLVYVKSAMGYPAIYPLPDVSFDGPAEAVLMDLDGTSVHSEPFWIWIIEQATARLLDDPKFELDEEDQPHVSGHRVSEHLQYCINKYCPDKTVEEARKHYFEITRFEMNEIMQGRGKADAFVPAPGLKEFLLELKSNDIKIGLVTSGLYEKAWPEILSAFKTLDMGDPGEFYDAIITAGFQPGHKTPGTLGELSPKPHPWLYAETARVGLAIDPSNRSKVIGIEDSGAGIASIRLAGFASIGIAGGNLESSGLGSMANYKCKNLHECLNVILNN